MEVVVTTQRLPEGTNTQVLKQLQGIRHHPGVLLQQNLAVPVLPVHSRKLGARQEEGQEDGSDWPARKPLWREKWNLWLLSILA